MPLKKKKAQQIIQQIDTDLTELKVHTPSLEDAYLETIDENKSS